MLTLARRAAEEFSVARQRPPCGNLCNGRVIKLARAIIQRVGWLRTDRKQRPVTAGNVAQRLGQLAREREEEINRQLRR